MKAWNAAELVELNIEETANGHIDAYVELSHNGFGFNNNLHDGGKDDGEETPSTPDTLS